MTATATTTPPNDKFNEEKQSLCICVLTTLNDQIQGFVENARKLILHSLSYLECHAHQFGFLGSSLFLYKLDELK